MQLTRFVLVVDSVELDIGLGVGAVLEVPSCCGPRCVEGINVSVNLIEIKSVLFRYWLVEWNVVIPPAQESVDHRVLSSVSVDDWSLLIW